MPVIPPRSVSSKAEVISGTRIVRYRVQRINRYWWKLTVTIPLRFHLCFPILWTDDRRDGFRVGMASAVRSWVAAISSAPARYSAQLNWRCM